MSRPPRLPRWLLERLLPRRHREYLLGDLEEEFAERHRRGVLHACVWYWAQALSTLTAYPARSPMSSLLGDLRIAFRGFRREPGFALVAVLTLAVGLGAVTSVFGMAHWVLLRPVPGVEAPDEMVTVEIIDAEGDDTGISYPNVADLAAGAPALAGLVGHTGLSVQAASDGLAPRTLRAELVTPGYFELLGIRAHRGRLIEDDETAPGSGARVALLTHDAWVSLFGEDPGVLGRELRLNGTTFTVVGITDRDFEGIERSPRVSLLLPATAYPALRRFPAEYHLGVRDFNLLYGMTGRLATGATIEQAETQLRAVARRLVEAYPDENQLLDAYRPRVFAGLDIDFRTRPLVQRTVRMLFALVSLVLFIAAANVANLLLVRGIRREGATAVRRALGGSRWAVARLHLAESLGLAIPGALGALLVTAGLNRVVWRAGIPMTGPLPDLQLQPAVVAFALVVAVVTTLAFGTLPALFASRVRVLERIKGSGRGTTRSVGWTRATLTVLQISLCLALLVSAVLVTRSLSNLRSVAVGMDVSGVQAVIVDPGPQGYGEAESTQYAEAVRQAIAALPNVESVAVTDNPPFWGVLWLMRVDAGREGANPPLASVSAVSADYFGVLGIPFLEGRAFRPDEASPDSDSDAVVVSRALADSLFGGRPALGRTVTLGSYRGDRVVRIIGVTENVRPNSLRNEPALALYQPLERSSTTYRGFLIRGAGSPAALSDAVVGAIASVDPDVPIDRSEPLAAGLDRTLLLERTLLRLLLVVGGLAVVLAGIGLYSVVAYTVAQRTREIGIRVALGAAPRVVARTVFARTLALGVAGAAVGTAVTALLYRLLGSVLYGVGALDPVVLAAGGAFLVLMVVVAGAAPARRALRIDPVEAIRAE